MATASGKSHCVTCRKEKVAYKCEGCSQNFCINHLADHHQIIGKQLDELEDKRNLFRQILLEQKADPQKYSLIQQINKWEYESINKIRQTAEDSRKLIIKHMNKHIDKIEIKLNKFTEQLRKIREENDFNEIILDEFKQNLITLEEALVKSSNISIEQDSSLFIPKISVIISTYIPNIPVNAKWIQNGITIAGGNGNGTGLNQLDGSWNASVDDDQTIYVADHKNHRVMEWKKGATSGQVVAGGNEAGNRNDQLNHPANVIVDKESDCLIISDSSNRRVVRWPRRNGTSGETIISNVSCRGLAIDNDGYLYVSDINKHEVRRWKIGDTNGTVVAGGNGAGSRLDQLNGPYYIFVDQDCSVYASDSGNHRVMKWIKDAKEGIVVAGGQGQGNALTQLSNPFGVIVDRLGTVYVADASNNRLMRWLKGAQQGVVVIDRNWQREQANQLNVPYGLSVDSQNNIYTVDNNNHRIQKFNIEPELNS